LGGAISASPLIIKKGVVFMIRGTTAQFKFKLPYTYGELEWVRIKFWQPGNPSTELPITKTKNMCGFVTDKENEVCVSLSATETAKFSDKYKAKVQLRAQPIVGLGAPFGSKEQLITVYPMHDDIIAEDPTVEPSIPTEEDWIVLDGEIIGGDE
jgi:hypothetical protein